MTANSDDNDDQNNTDHDNSRLETKTKLILIRTKRYSRIYSLMAMLIFISTVLVLYTPPHLHPSHKKNYLADTAWGHGHIVCVHHVVLPARIIYEKKPSKVFIFLRGLHWYLSFVRASTSKWHYGCWYKWKSYQSAMHVRAASCTYWAAERGEVMMRGGT